MAILPESLFPEPIGPLVRSLGHVGFFERAVLIGSWVMPVYQEVYGVRYALRTLDLDFAVQVAHPRAKRVADLETLISGLGFTSFFAAEGRQKFTGGGYEIEFFVNRAGSGPEEPRTIAEWGISALPLPFLRMLLDFTETADLAEGACLRFPIPEAYFLHKLIIAQRRILSQKRERDLDQCAALAGALDNNTLQRVMASLNPGLKTRRAITASCLAIGFPLLHLFPEKK